MDAVETQADEKPKWLKRLQENSWEAEILISGGAIFSLFQLDNYLTNFIAHVREIRQITGLSFASLFLFLGTNGITIGFFVHLALRGFWIGLVCLHYGSPQGINFKKLSIQGIYQKETQSFSLLHQIVKLDKISGEMFFLSLAFLLAVIGFILISAVSLTLFAFFDISEFVFFGLSLVFFLDFFSGGPLRRFRVIGLIYRPLYLYFNYLSLAFIYRPWFQILFTNSNRVKAVLGGLIFFGIAVIFTISSVSPTLHFKNFVDDRLLDLSFGKTRWTDNFYENKIRGGEKIAYVSIQSDLVTDNYLRIFIPYKIRYDQFIIDQKAVTFQEIIIVRLDGQLIPNPDWLAGDVANQPGIICYLPIEQLGNGKHILTLELKSSDTLFPFPLTIPFWKQ